MMPNNKVVQYIIHVVFSLIVVSLIAFAIYITQSGWSLWALIFLPSVNYKIKEFSKAIDKALEDKEGKG